MRARVVTIAVGTALVAAGVAVAALPFNYSIDLGRGESAKADCRRPLVAAWSTARKGELGVWAVTYGTEESGYEVRDGAEPYCAAPARVRLAAAVVMIIVGFGTGLWGVRRGER